MVRVLNRGSVRFLNLIIHYVNGEIFGTEKRWSVFRDGPLCEAVRYRVSTVYNSFFYEIFRIDAKLTRKYGLQNFMKIA